MTNSTIAKKIIELKQQKNAIILAHNYQIAEVQDIADFCGDSLDLAIKATKTDADVIVFCGVKFMGESAKILNPNKTVILPDPTANCPMAGMVDPESLKAMINDHPQAEVVSYINTTAEIKSLTDVCCTSSNGVNVVKSVKSKEVIFVPDINLGQYIQRFIKDKKMVLWQGLCPTHHKIKKGEINKLKTDHPEAEVLVHPECRPEIIDIADHAFSTNGMVNYVKESKVHKFIIGTESGICHRLEKENPNKQFFSLPSAICPNMKKITVEKIIKSLETLEPTINLSQEILTKANVPLQKMMNIGRGD